MLMHGKLYVTNKFICFYCFIFAKERKIRIPFNIIKSISRANTAFVFANAVEIVTGTPCSSTLCLMFADLECHVDAKTYVFRSFWAREEVFERLTSIWQEQLKTSQQSSTGNAYGVNAA